MGFQRLKGQGSPANEPVVGRSASTVNVELMKTHGSELDRMKSWTSFPLLRLASVSKIEHIRILPRPAHRQSAKETGGGTGEFSRILMALCPDPATDPIA
jgi:hypothetical protein